MYYSTLLTQEYQLARVTSPAPLPGTITAFTARDMADCLAGQEKLDIYFGKIVIV